MDNDLLSMLLGTQSIFGAGSRTNSLIERLQARLAGEEETEDDAWYSGLSSEGIGGCTQSGYRHLARQAQGWLDEGYDSPYVVYNPAGKYGTLEGMALTEDALRQLSKGKKIADWLSERSALHGSKNIFNIKGI